MKIKLKSKDLVKIRKQLREEMEKFGEQQKQLIELDKEHEKSKHKINRIKDKGLKELDKVLKEQYSVDEFDYFVNYEAINDEELELELKNVYNDTFNDPENLKKKLRDDKKNKLGLWADKTMYVGHK